MSGIRKFQIFRYLKRWLPLVVCFFIGMTFFSTKVLERKQRYTASAVIEYTNEGARDGLAPDGSPIDVSEIASSSNMARVMENLGLPLSSYSLDSLCAGVRVEPIIEQQEKHIQEAVNDTGEAYTIQSTTYIVSFSLGSSGSTSLVRDILNELLDVYFSDYSNKHINQGQVSNQAKDLMHTDYDYLEMVEQLEKQLTETVNTLYTRYTLERSFRSARTGCSFADLQSQFDLILKVDIPRLYSLILGNRLTRDRELLLSKYRNRIAGYHLASQSAQGDIQDILHIIENYVTKMRESGNTDISHSYILGDIYERDREKEGASSASTNRTVEYDALLKDWAAAADRWDYAEIDAAYCAYIINIYQGGEDGLSGGQAISAQEMEREIAGVIERMNGLYETVTETNTEYNQYLGAKNIKTLSSVSARAELDLSAYQTIIAVFFLVVGCCGAILLGRAGDILEYLFLRDRATGCMNRVCCDQYIHDRENLILPLGSSCVSIQIVNQRELNETYGREETDQAFKEFGRVLRELFEYRKNGFVGYNGGGQFWVFFEAAAQESFRQEVEQMEIMLRQTISSVPVAYQMGAVNAGEEAVFSLRGLISSAVTHRRSCQTGAAGLTGSGPAPQEETHEEQAEQP